ncbi:MAG: hypothetical protein IJA10_10630 [Lachnospiraceae bacterium]|nr:hypothetical protein [Lachnospiraceae bacterium]
MYAVKSEDKYTLEEARNIIKKERAKKKEDILYKIKQKIIGLVAIGISIITLAMSGDATVSLFMLLLGLYLIFTKDKAVY